MNETSDLIVGIIGICIILLVLIGMPILIIHFIRKRNRFIKIQLETGEDKRTLINFAGSILKNPETYRYAVGYNTVTKYNGNTTTIFYFSYIIAFNENIFHVISFKSDKHIPVFRGVITYNYTDMQLTHKKTKKGITLTLHMAGEKQPITIPNITKSDGRDNTSTPFVVEQTNEVLLLEKLLPMYEARSNQPR